MKNLILTTILLTLCCVRTGFGQVPAEILFDLSGKQVHSKDVVKNDGPILLVFWTTTCHNMIDGLIDINDDLYEDWQNDYGMKLIAISLDDARNQSKVGPFVNGKDWGFETYIDPNGDFKRVMNVNIHPHLFLLDDQGKVVWQKTSYLEGDTDIITAELEKLK